MNHPTRLLALASGIAIAVGLAGCVTPGPKSGSIYDANSSGSMQNVNFGRVVDLRQVAIDKSTGTTQAFAASVGGTVGAAAGSSVAKRGSGWNTVGGAVGAGVAAYGADAAMRALNTVAGYEITIRLEDNRVVSVTQETDTPIAQGACVKVVFGSSQARVSPSSGCVK